MNLRRLQTLVVGAFVVAALVACATSPADELGTGGRDSSVAKDTGRPIVKDTGAVVVVDTGAPEEDSGVLPEEDAGETPEEDSGPVGPRMCNGALLNQLINGLACNLPGVCRAVASCSDCRVGGLSECCYQGAPTADGGQSPSICVLAP